MFDTILIANRGEIAVRIITTCREMGIRTVAVYSEADRDALHVLEADRAVLLGPSEPSRSYLDMDRIIAAARESGAQAIHPGYGFLAENADFAERCSREGLVFIGPPAQVIRDLGNKTVARRTMAASGVPVIPGMMEPGENPDALKQEAEKIGFPVLIKAAAGGGGKGMRVVRSPEDFVDACASASREAAAAFGNGDVYLEKFIEKPRHVEFRSWRTVSAMWCTSWSGSAPSREGTRRSSRRRPRRRSRPSSGDGWARPRWRRPGRRAM